MKAKVLFVSMIVLSSIMMVSLLATAQDSQKTEKSVVERINVNTATLEELESLPGIGPKLGQLVIDGRPYKTIDSLIDVQGIGEKKLAAIRNLVTVGEDTTEMTSGDDQAPKKDEKKAEGVKEPDPKKMTLVDINSATKEELDALPGISENVALAIIDGRPYEKVEDLLGVKGIGPKTLETIQALVDVKPVAEKE